MDDLISDMETDSDATAEKKDLKRYSPEPTPYQDPDRIESQPFDIGSITDITSDRCRDKQIIRLAFCPSNIDLLTLLQACPRLQTVQIPPSCTISLAAQRFLETQGIELIKGDLGHGKDIKNIINDISQLTENLRGGRSDPDPEPESRSHVHVKIPGRKSFRFYDIGEAETIGTLTEKISKRLGVDMQNWGFYMMGTKRNFLADSTRVRDLKLNHDRNLHFLPRMVVR